MTWSGRATCMGRDIQLSHFLFPIPHFRWTLRWFNSRRGGMSIIRPEWITRHMDTHVHTRTHTQSHSFSHVHCSVLIINSVQVKLLSIPSLPACTNSCNTSDPSPPNSQVPLSLCSTLLKSDKDESVQILIMLVFLNFTSQLKLFIFKNIRNDWFVASVKCYIFKKDVSKERDVV